MIANSQPGFMNGRSCLTNLIALHDEMTGCVNKGRTKDVEYFDFYQGLETKVSPSILVTKLNWLDEWTMKWMENWLDCWA